MNEAEAQIHESVETKLLLLAEGGDETIMAMAERIVEALGNGGRLYIFGNGGSAADAQHLAGELVGRFMMERRALPCQAFTTDTSVLTAVANDYGYDDVFSRQVEAFVGEGDVCLAISTSGGSPNVNRAARLAKEKGAAVLGLSGKGGGELAELADLCITVPADTSPRIQECHITIGHILCDIVERRLCGEEE